MKMIFAVLRKGNGMAKIHDKYVIELAEVIKGYGNDPDVDDPFHLSEFYRFYELPEIAVSENHFKTMIPLEVEKAKGRKTIGLECLRCKQTYDYSWDTMDEISYTMYSYCPDCIRKGIQLLKSQDKEGEQNTKADDYCSSAERRSDE